MMMCKNYLADIFPKKAAGILIILSLFALSASAQNITDVVVEWKDENTKIFTVEVAEEGIDRLVMDGYDGAVRIETGTTSTIQIRVEIKAKRQSGIFSSSNGKAYTGQAELDINRRGYVLKANLFNGPGREDIQETWTVTVPPHLGVAVKMNGADVDISGVEGGVDLDLGVGETHVTVPHGSLKIKVAVGDAVVTTTTDSFGDVSLRSQVGDTELHLHNHRINYPNPPGSGSNVSLEGKGRDRIELFVQVGTAKLTIL